MTAMKRWLPCNHDISDMNLSDRPRWTDEKALACDMATKQDVLDVLKLVEQAIATYSPPIILRRSVTPTGCFILLMRPDSKWSI